MIIKNDNIPFLEGYFISKNGRLWSRYDKSGHITKDSWHRVKYNTSNVGYKFIQRKGKTYSIHRCSRDGRTLNGDKNPMWGISRRGAANPNAKLSKAQRKEILFRYKANERICDLANEFKASRLTIRRIINPKLRSFNRLK